MPILGLTVTRDRRREVDPNWKTFEEMTYRALAQKETNPAVAVRVEVADEAHAVSIWRLLTDEEKTVVVVSWTTAHFMSRHPQWVGLAQDTIPGSLMVVK